MERTERGKKKQIEATFKPRIKRLNVENVPELSLIKVPNEKTELRIMNGLCVSG